MQESDLDRKRISELKALAVATVLPVSNNESRLALQPQDLVTTNNIVLQIDNRTLYRLLQPPISDEANWQSLGEISILQG